MASYLIMTPPGAAADDERARFIADGFSWAAFFFPALWLIAKRAWLLGISVAVLQIVFILLSEVPGCFTAALIMQLALSLLVSLEGPLFVARKLAAEDWTLRSIVPARNIETAEEIYFSNATATTHHQSATPLQSNDWSSSGRPESAAGLGFFESYGER
ncbi:MULTISPECIES: DUF2628 domain-containing protein [Sinorhizobium]|uniref:DUF2628 domain-containing protein n=1 Tax=Sinorhizobium americanum TaxID=194963 RepID=A0A2S3YI68_9HYPH|nr:MULTISPECIES: DUF2628 domain-containing protein [Sinorhizobium]ASY58736.1 hypothetical protein SS05631_c38240 [Sinorhizobium sp. CCBAU 05631]PDT40859.1 DUF2628 domain-containing protein [Sinorhizobium sp. FG01]PDT52045.1 DUF2628 domain-containing protein [Sinorhizobium sp. NG07B]POH26694.1 hypothetical protein ATY31_22290 [Sinorhizobium americanum]POH27360.1 hypothetical protein ATY30_24165 [Sinorhizobium americanum]